MRSPDLVRRSLASVVVSLVFGGLVAGGASIRPALALTDAERAVGPAPGPSTVGRETTKTQGDFNLSNRFTVVIDGVVVPGVTRISSPDIERTVAAFRTQHRIHHPSGRSMITKDWSNTSDQWYKWRQAVLTGNASRKASISIIFHNDAGEEPRRMNFYQCWPSNYTLNARSSGHPTETIEVRYESLELKIGS